MSRDTEIKDFELKEALRLLHDNLIISSVVSVLVSSVFIFSFHINEQVNTNHKFIWWLTMITLVLLRFVDSVLHQKKRSLTQLPAEKKIRRFSFFSVLIAGVWGFYPVYFYPFQNLTELTAITIILCGISSGVANMWSGHKFTAISCVLIMSGPLAILLLLSEDTYYRLLGIGGVAYTLVMSMSAAKFSSFTYKTIHLKYQNVQLLQHMEEKVEQRTQEIYRLSNLDSLTGLLNRTAFLKELHQTISENASTPFALLFIDLDDFKQINDNLGHEVGDKVIKETASRIATSSRSELSICRWGGDEFLLIKKFKNIKEIDELSKQLINLISLPHSITQSRTWVGATIGVALYPEHGNSYDTLIQNADIAMYHQKRLEKSKMNYFNESLRLQIIREHLLSARLFTAIEENALRLVFQPIVESKTSSVSGLETLLRWRLDDEEVTPSEFIPIAEQYGMIKTIGLWVVEKACQQIVSLSKTDKPLTVSVNVSIIQLQDKEFVAEIKKLHSRLSFNPNLLHIEITESVFAADKKVLMAQINALQKIGIKISIDDFGTGYSSLSSMQDLGVDIVKIDKSFVDKINGTGLSIIKAVMQIAHSMNYQVVAEGVESQEQVEKLNHIGVHFLQGHFFSEPLETDQLTDYLNHHL